MSVTFSIMYVRQQKERVTVFYDNNQLYFNFRMKGFPDLALRNGSKASFSEPRIGETVAGANEFATGLMNPAESQLISLQT